MGHYFLDIQYVHVTTSETYTYLEEILGQTVYPGSSDPFNILTYYIIWVTTSRTDGTIIMACYKGHL